MRRVHSLQFFVFVVFSLISHLAAGQDGPAIPSEGASSTYRIAPLDVLRIRLFVADEVQFEKELRVSQDGMVTLPYLEQFRIEGRTVEEARAALYEPYNRDYYVDPQIEIIVLSYSSRTVTVIGKVNRQGSVEFPAEEPMYLLEAIARAGGWSNDRLADKKNVTITRDGEGGQKRVIEVDARRITARDHPLEDGDLITVPERIW